MTMLLRCKANAEPSSIYAEPQPAMRRISIVAQSYNTVIAGFECLGIFFHYFFAETDLGNF